MFSTQLVNKSLMHCLCHRGWRSLSGKNNATFQSSFQTENANVIQGPTNSMEVNAFIKQMLMKSWEVNDNISSYKHCLLYPLFFLNCQKSNPIICWSHLFLSSPKYFNTDKSKDLLPGNRLKRFSIPSFHTFL